MRAVDITVRYRKPAAWVFDNGKYRLKIEIHDDKEEAGIAELLTSDDVQKFLKGLVKPDPPLPLADPLL